MESECKPCKVYCLECYSSPSDCIECQGQFRSNPPLCECQIGYFDVDDGI